MRIRARPAAANTSTSGRTAPSSGRVGHGDQQSVLAVAAAVAHHIDRHKEADMAQSPEQERVDRAYRAMTNTEYDARHGYADREALVQAQDRYREALDARDEKAGR